AERMRVEWIKTVDQVTIREANQRDNGQHYCQYDHLTAEATREDALTLRPRRTVHDVGFTRLETECDRGEAIGDKIDPQNLNRQKRDWHANQDSDQHHEDFADVTAEQIADEFTDIVVNRAAFLNSRDNAGEVVIGEHHIGRTLADLGAGDAHRDADIGLLERGGIIDAVTCHSGHFAGRLERLN